MKIKQCPKCKITKLHSEYYTRTNNGKKELQPYCIECDKKRISKYNADKSPRNDKRKLIEMLERFGVEYKVTNEPEFIMDEAKEHGAIESVCVRNHMDFAFDKNEKCVGHYTINAKSWVKR